MFLSPSLGQPSKHLKGHCHMHIYDNLDHFPLKVSSKQSSDLWDKISLRDFDSMRSRLLFAQVFGPKVS